MDAQQARRANFTSPGTATFSHAWIRARCIAVTSGAAEVRDDLLDLERAGLEDRHERVVYEAVPHP